jgi:hypothetical protein
MKFLQLVLYSTLLAMLPGCGSEYSTALLLENTSKGNVVKALWKAGAKRFENQPFASSGEKQIWRNVDEVSKNKTVMKYELSDSLATIYGKDTVGIETKEPNRVSLSLRCEERKVGFIDPLGFFFPIYHRNVRRERKVLLQTVYELQQKNNVIVESLGRWKPANMPVIVRRDDSSWVAYRGKDASIVRNYLIRNGYQSSSESSSSRMIFEREKVTEPSFFGSNIRSISSEQIVSKVIRLDSTDNGSIVAFGVAAIGVWQRHSFFWPGGPGRPQINSDEVRDDLVNEICHEVSVNLNSTDFVDPSTWIEEIKLSETTDDIYECIKELGIIEEQRRRGLL